MNAPFVLAEGLDVQLFPSLDALVDWVEAQDVRDGDFEAFDADGIAIELTAESSKNASRGRPAGGMPATSPNSHSAFRSRAKT